MKYWMSHTDVKMYLRTPGAQIAAPQSSGRFLVSVHRVHVLPLHLHLCTSLNLSWVLCRRRPDLRRAEHPTTARIHPCTASFCWVLAFQAGSLGGQIKYFQEDPGGTHNARNVSGKAWLSSECWLLRTRWKTDKALGHKMEICLTVTFSYT